MADRVVGSYVIFAVQRSLRRLLQESVQATMLKELPALHKALQASGKMLQHVVNAATFLQQGFSKTEEKSPFVCFEASREGAVCDGVERLHQCCCLLAVG